MSITQFGANKVEAIRYQHLRYAVLAAGDILFVPVAPWDGDGEYRFITDGHIHVLSDGRWGGTYTFDVIGEPEALALHMMGDTRLFNLEHPDTRLDHDFDAFFGLGGFLNPGSHSFTRFGVETRHGETLFFLEGDSVTPYRRIGVFDKQTLKRARWEQAISAAIAEAQKNGTPRLVPIGHPTNIGVFVPHLELIDAIGVLAPLPPVPA